MEIKRLTVTELSFKMGGTVAQLVKRATPNEGVVGLIPAVTVRSLLVRSVSVYGNWMRWYSWSPRSVCARQHLKLSDICLGTFLRHSLVIDEDVKKPNKQTFKMDLTNIWFRSGCIRT